LPTARCSYCFLLCGELMKVTTAFKQLNKECDFLGLPFDELLNLLAKYPLSFPNKTIEAYKVYRMEFPIA